MVSTEEFARRIEKFGLRLEVGSFFGMNHKVTVICPHHGHVTVDAANVQRRGCPRCGDARCGQRAKIGLVEFIDRAHKKHGDKFDYSQVDIQGMDKSIIVGCPKHGSFVTTPDAHLKGCGCPECGKEVRSAKMIELWKDPEFYQKVMSGIADSREDEMAIIIRLESEMGREWADGFRAGLHYHESWPYKLPPLRNSHLGDKKVIRSEKR